MHTYTLPQRLQDTVEWLNAIRRCGLSKGSQSQRRDCTHFLLLINQACQHTHILLITHANNNHCQYPMYGGVTTTTVLGTKFTQLLMTIALWPSFTVIISGHVTALCYSMITTVIVAVCYCYYFYYCYYYCWCSSYYYYRYFSKLPIALKFEKMQPLLLLPSSFYQLIQLSLQCENGLLQVILQYRSSQPSLALKNNTKTYFLYIYTKHKTNSTVPYRVQ